MQNITHVKRSLEISNSTNTTAMSMLKSKSTIDEHHSKDLIPDGGQSRIADH